MPAYRGKRIFFYFWAFKKHIGIYPPVKADKQLIAELAPYRGPKGNLSFPLSSPLPIELIGRVAMALYREHEQTDEGFARLTAPTMVTMRTGSTLN